jgi:hypothetical protein
VVVKDDDAEGGRGGLGQLFGDVLDLLSADAS